MGRGVPFLDLIQEGVNFACVCTFLEIDELDILELDGKMTINGPEICITTEQVPEICRIMLCSSTQGIELDIRGINSLHLIKDDTGYKFI